MAPFIPAAFPAGDLTVSIAWGADITADPDTWVWTDITEDVYQDPGITVVLGRSDEAGVSQPATCELILNNSSGDYSVGGESANWPNVRQGTPLVVTVDPDGSSETNVFYGYTNGFTPSWDLTGAIPTAAVSSAGTLRRLGQGQSPLQSAYLRGTIGVPTLITYFPMEEGKQATAFKAAVGNGRAYWTGNDRQVQTGTPDLAANSDFVSSAPLPVLRNANLIATVPFYVAGPNLHCTMLAAFGTDVEPGDATLISLQTSGTAKYIELGYDPASGGSLSVGVYNRDDTLVHSSGPFSFDLHTSSVRTVRLHLIVEAVGANLSITYGVARIDGDTSSASTTAVGVTLGACDIITINGLAPDGVSQGVLEDVAVGHLVLRTDIAGDLTEDSELIGAWAGEYAEDRIERLAAEVGETVEIIGTSSVEMGPQGIATFLELLREVELADDGVLYDGVGPGLTYVCRSERENRPPDLTVDAGAGQELAYPFQPVHDDQRIRNKVTVTRKDASDFTHEDVTGQLGTAAIGIYDTSLTVNVNDDETALRLAEWKVHAGTQDGYRYPELTLDLGATPALAPGVLALGPSTRVDVEDADLSLTGHPGSGVALLVEGIEHNMTGASWTTTAKCSSFNPWNIAQLSGATDVPTFTGVGESFSTASSTPADVAVGIFPEYEPGDLLLIFATVRNSGTGTINTPDGWEPLLTSGNVSILGRIAREYESYPDITATNGAVNATLLIQSLGFHGAHRDLSQIVAASAAQLNASAQNIAYPALTVPENNCMILVFGWKQDDWTSVAPIAGMTEISEVDSTLGDDAGIVTNFAVQTTATNIAAGSLVVTGGAAAISRGLVLALRPDPDPLVTRLDTDGSTLASSISAGATSISVTTTSGPVWTTTSTDMPYDIEVGGVKFTVTACSDGTSPQTMTISPAPVARAAGVPVKLWQPPVLAR